VKDSKEMKAMMLGWGRNKIGEEERRKDGDKIGKRSKRRMLNGQGDEWWVSRIG
jgi:hypothetical protein